MRKKGMEVSAKLKNIVILDCNKEAFYKKVPTASAYECLPLYLKKHTQKKWSLFPALMFLVFICYVFVLCHFLIMWHRQI